MEGLNPKSGFLPSINTGSRAQNFHVEKIGPRKSSIAVKKNTKMGNQNLEEKKG